MDGDSLKKLLENVKEGRLGVEDALGELSRQDRCSKKKGYSCYR